MKGSVAYLTLQATREGQAAHAHVHEIVEGLRDNGWAVDLHEPIYRSEHPGVLARLTEFRRVQRRLIARLNEYDVVYIRAHALALPTSRAAGRASVPVVQECNGPYDDMFLAWPQVRPIARWLVQASRAQYTSADAVIAVTASLAEWLSAEAGSLDVTIIPNGANTSLFAPTAPRPSQMPKSYVVFYGALARWQGIGTCLAAAAHDLWPEGVALVIVGDGALRGEVQDAALENPERIRYFGTAPYRSIPGIAAHACASLIPMPLSQRNQRSDLSPLKLYESLACGVPVIVSDIPGLSETVRSAECGIVIPPDDPIALAEAVAYLSKDSQGAAEMGARGRLYAVEHASWRSRADDTSAVLEQVVGLESASTAPRAQS